MTLVKVVRELSPEELKNLQAKVSVSISQEKNPFIGWIIVLSQPDPRAVRETVEALGALYKE